jgi:predicted metal-dependent hydrolase
MPAELPPIEIRASARRTKTVSAHWSGDTVVVSVPARLTATERRRWAEQLAAKLVAERGKARTDSDAKLGARAADLSAQYLEGKAEPANVRWVSNQSKRWGSCTPSSREIRISDSLKRAPEWVLDAVLLHELAHLIEASHNRAFKALVRRYPRHAEADAFLAGYALGLASR